MFSFKITKKGYTWYSYEKMDKTKIIVWIFYTTFQLQIDLQNLNYFAISK